MFRRDQFGIVFNSVFALYFGGLLTAFSLFGQGNLSFENLCKGFVSAYAINFTIGSYVPLVKIGDAFARLFAKNEKSLLFYLLRMFMIVLIMTACMSFLMLFINLGFSPMLFPAFFGSFLPSLAFAYVIGVLGFPLLFKLTQSLCSK